MVLNNRDIAAIIGIAALALFLWRNHSLGGIAGSFIRIFVSRPFIWLWLLLLAWTTLLVLGAARIGLWEPSLLHDTGLSLVPAGSLVVGAMDAARTEGWYRKRIGRAIGLGALVEVLVQSTSYDLLPEVVLLVVLSFAAMTAALAGSSYDPTGGAAPRWANRVVILGGLILLSGPVLYVIQNAGTMDWGLFGRELILPAWLTVLTLPLAFYMSLVSTYEDAFVRLRWWADGHPTWQQRLALVVGFNLHPRALNQFVYRTNTMFELARTKAFREAVKVVRRPAPPPTADHDENEESEDEPEVPATAPVAAPGRRKHHRPHGRRRSH